MLADLLRLFDESSPDVRSDVVDACEPEVLERVRQREADVGLVYCTRTTDLERLFSRELEVAMVHREPLVLVSSTRRWDEDPTSLTALGAARWLLPATFDGYPGLATSVEQAFQRAGVVPTSTRTCASLVTGVRMVAAGDAVTLAPHRWRPSHARSGPRLRPSRNPWPPSRQPSSGAATSARHRC